MSQQPQVDSKVWLRELRHRTLNVLLGATVLVGTVGVLFSLGHTLISGEPSPTLPGYLAGYGVALALFFVRRIPDQWRASILLAALYGFAIFALRSGWLASSGRTFLLAAIVSAAILIGPRAGSFAAGLGLVTYVIFALAFIQGWLDLRPLPSPVTVPPIIIEGVGFAIAIGITAIGLTFLRRALSTAMQATEEAERTRGLLAERAQQVDEAIELLAERTQGAEKAKQEAEAANRQLEAQMWSIAGQAELNAEMRGQQDLNTLSARVIRQLCRYLDAPVGALFVMEDNRLRLMGSYAYTHRKSPTNQFQRGQGLVGQAALEKQPIIISKVPDDYMSVGLGLGDVVPNQILVSPFIYEGQVRGVVELATLTEFTSAHLAFLERAMENIAIAFHTAQARSRIDELLQQTQRQAEALQVREGELEAANEELASQTENLRASQARLRQNQAQLEAANVALEEKANALQESSAALLEKQVVLDRQNQELKAAQSELERKAEELALASQYKSEFLANMSHELRTPLNSLLILARMLADNEKGNLSAEQVESAQIIHNSGSDLLNLINQILDLSKVEAGKMAFHIAPMALSDLVTSMRAQFTPVAQNKELDFQIAVADDLPGSIQTDQQRVEQIIKNLLSNAFKFTESGGVQLNLRRPEPDAALARNDLDPAQTLAISVIDTGIGMTAEQQQGIFEAFQQADGSTSRRYGGTGLGLAISRELATNLGGYISLQSEIGQGSTFTLYLPTTGPAEQVPEEATLAEPAAPPPSPPPPQAPAAAPLPAPSQTVEDDRDRLQEGDKILLVIEDDPPFAQIACDYARQREFKCLVAGDGESGVSLAQTYQPDAVLLDLNLPGLNGWDVLKALKQDPDTRHIPVHIVSAADEDLTAYKMGAMGFLTKPASPQDLEGVFQKIEGFISREIKTLLLVEDDRALRHSVKQLLGGEDISISEAGLGQKALELLRVQPFDCMILDLNLPDMSGFELLSQMDQDESIAKCPVIVYTGKELTQEENLELIRYADSVIVKGVKSPERLLDETALFLHQVVADMSQEKQRTIKQLHAREAALAGKEILIVDDDARNAFALSKLLADKGIQVTIARNGRKALELLDETPEINLVLMDIMMPEMDGYETIAHIRRQPRFRDLPILALTAKAMKGDAEKCLAAGANDYLPKPVDVDRLFSMLRVWLYR